MQLKIRGKISFFFIVIFINPNEIHAFLRRRGYLHFYSVYIDFYSIIV